MFCLSWLITWFGHVLDSYDQIVRLYDFFLSTHSLMPIYLAAAVVLHREEEVLDLESDMAIIHHFLSNVPDDLPFESLISKAMWIFAQYPPDELMDFTLAEDVGLVFFLLLLLTSGGGGAGEGKPNIVVGVHWWWWRINVVVVVVFRVYQQRRQWISQTYRGGAVSRLLTSAWTTLSPCSCNRRRWLAAVATLLPLAFAVYFYNYPFVNIGNHFRWRLRGFWWQVLFLVTIEMILFVCCKYTYIINFS